MQHGNFVDDEHAGFFKPLPQILLLFELFERVIVNIFANADARPAVDGHAVHMRGRDAGGSRDSHGNGSIVEPFDVLAQRMRFSRTGRTGKVYVHSGFHYGERLRLGHMGGL